MLVFEVSDMTCGHCVSTITAAAQNVAPEATITTNLSGRVVRVEGNFDADAIEQAIREAGYSPTLKA